MDAPEEILKRFQKTYQDALEAEQKLLECILKLEEECTRLGNPPDLKKKLDRYLKAFKNLGDAKEKAREDLQNLHDQLG